MSELQPTPVEIKPADGRDTLGRFVKGVSGNPQGRPKDAKNRSTWLKQVIEEGLVQDLEGQAKAIMQKAIELALEGDKAMLKLLLDKLVSNANNEDSDKAAVPKINITIKDLEVKANVSETETEKT